jgi:4-hydroxy-3-polyprenylbenzoate decarboxylase
LTASERVINHALLALFRAVQRIEPGHIFKAHRIGVRGHQLDPSQMPDYSPSIRGQGITCKTIFDCTVPWALKSRFERAPFADVDPRPFAPDYLAKRAKTQ